MSIITATIERVNFFISPYMPYQPQSSCPFPISDPTSLSITTDKGEFSILKEVKCELAPIRDKDKSSNKEVRITEPFMAKFKLTQPATIRLEGNEKNSFSPSNEDIDAWVRAAKNFS
jgi:hypothetical protein